MYQRFVVIDIETTGNSPKKDDRIIQVGAVVIENGAIVDRFSSFVNPGRDIPLFIENFTGINDSMVAEAPSFEKIAPEILKLLKGAYFVAHNVPFDLNFLQQELKNAGFEKISSPAIDTVELARIVMPTANSYKLGDLADQLKITHDNPHQADSDAEVTGELLLTLFRKLEDLPLVLLQRLKMLERHLKSDLRDILDSIIRAKLEHYNDDERRFDIYRGLALRKADYPMHGHLRNNPLSDWEEESTLLHYELMLSKIEGFEARQGQAEMLKTVGNSLEEKNIAIIEAGTGIGKTMAYLLPAVVFSKKQLQPIVVSTHTIQLQQQIMDRDIPLLKEILPFPFEAVILKGRSHYIDLRKFEQALYEHDDNYDTVLAKAQIAVWLTETETGDSDEINLPSGGRFLWNKVKSTGGREEDESSPWKTRCFYARARQRANQADLIIVNHALLFADIDGDGRTLPSYKNVILDEAHHLERIASEKFGIKLDYFSLNMLFSKIGTMEGQELFNKVIKIIESTGFEEEETYFAIDGLLKDARLEVDELFRMLHAFALRKKNQEKQANRISVHIDAKGRSKKSWSAIMEAGRRFKFILKDLTLKLSGLQALIELRENMLSDYQQGILADFFSHKDVFEEIRNNIQISILEDDPDSVTWVEIEAKGAKNATYIYRQPLEVSTVLADRFFSKLDSAILTSATLTVKDSYQYYINRLGLEGFNPHCLTIPSPFDYEKQAKLMIPSDLPEIKGVSLEEFAHAVSIGLGEIAKTTNGRMMVLFTSYEMLKLSHSFLKDLPYMDEFVLIAQGVSGGSRTKLTKNFQAFEKSILLGTSSFWEGVDLPGKDLSCLVIVRLPFASPDDPVVAARNKRIKEMGGNPFQQLAIPEAVIRFKQGFGRLVRTRTDKGVVFVFDRRIVTAKYGRHFLGSLPKLEVVEGELDHLLRSLSEWLE